MITPGQGAGRNGPPRVIDCSESATWAQGPGEDGEHRFQQRSREAEKQRSREARQNLGWDWIVLCVGCQSMEWVVGSPLCKPTGGELSGESISADAFVLQWAYRAAPRQTRPPDRGLQPHPNYHIRPSYGHKATRPDGRDIRQPTTPNQ
jgi:hypothetical protein